MNDSSLMKILVEIANIRHTYDEKENPYKNEQIDVLAQIASQAVCAAGIPQFICIKSTFPHIKKEISISPVEQLFSALSISVSIPHDGKYKLDNALYINFIVDN